MPSLKPMPWYSATYSQASPPPDAVVVAVSVAVLRSHLRLHLNKVDERQLHKR